VKIHIFVPIISTLAVLFRRGPTSVPGQTRHFDHAPTLPIYPDKQTFSASVGMSQKCQTRKSPVVGQRRGHRNLKFNLVVSADC
jgi:hypothetical protein